MTKQKISQFFESMTEQRTIISFKTVYDDAVVFQDPFNKVEGIDAVYNIFSHMYENLDKPRFHITEYIENDNIAYVKWDFIFHFKGDKTESHFEGVSRLEINADNKITSHTDYWDAAEHIYEKLPLIGSLLRFIKRKIASS